MGGGGGCSDMGDITMVGQSLEGIAINNATSFIYAIVNCCDLE